MTTSNLPWLEEAHECIKANNHTALAELLASITPAEERTEALRETFIHFPEHETQKNYWMGLLEYTLRFGTAECLGVLLASGVSAEQKMGNAVNSGAVPLAQAMYSREPDSNIVRTLLEYGAPLEPFLRTDGLGLQRQYERYNGQAFEFTGEAASIADHWVQHITTTHQLPPLRELRAGGFEAPCKDLCKIASIGALPLLLQECFQPNVWLGHEEQGVEALLALKNGLPQNVADRESIKEACQSAINTLRRDQRWPALFDTSLTRSTNPQNLPLL